MRFSLLIKVYKTAIGATYVLLLITDGEQLLNESKRPLLELNKTLFAVLGGNIRKAVNIAHECTNTSVCVASNEGDIFPHHPLLLLCPVPSYVRHHINPI